MTVRLSKSFGLFVVGYITCMIASAKADWSYDFESPLPASFIFAPIGPPTGTFSGGIDNGVLRLSDPHVLQGGPPLGAISRETSQVFQNARMSGVLNAAGTSDDFLGLNLNSPASGDDAYGARIEFNSGRLAIFKVVDFLPVFAVGSDSPEQGSQPLLSNLARSYFLQFDVVDNVLDARCSTNKVGMNCCTCATSMMTASADRRWGLDKPGSPRSAWQALSTAPSTTSLS